MQWTFKGQGALWIVAVSAGLGTGASSASAIIALDVPALSLQSSVDRKIHPYGPVSEPIDRSVFDFVLTPSSPQNTLDESGAIPLSQLLTPVRVSMERRAALNGAAAFAGAAAMVPATGEGARVWMLLAVRCVYHTDPGRDRRSVPEKLELAVEQSEGDFDFVAASVRSVPRSLKELLVGPLRRRYDDRSQDADPFDTPEMLAAYPTPGAAGLALIAGGCALCRRRR